MQAGTNLRYFCRVSEQMISIKGTLTYFAGLESNRCRDGDGDDRCVRTSGNTNGSLSKVTVFLQGTAKPLFWSEYIPAIDRHPSPPEGRGRLLIAGEVGGMGE